MNLLKRTTASVALVALVSGLFSTGVSADYASEVAAANALAEKNVINSVSTAADYRLGATITRAEMAKVTANLAGITPNATCEGRFADVSATTPNDWVCGYVEALLDAGLISANVNYNPNANVSKTEALRFSLNASGEVVSYGDVTWQADYVNYAVENGFVSSFADYNTAATRGFVFSAAAAASMEEEEEDDILGQLEDLLNSDEDEDMSNEDMTDDNMEDDDTTVVVSGDNVLSVELSPKSPSSATIPGGVNGLTAAAFEVTAGSEDVTVSQVSVKRSGLSDKDTLESLAIFTDAGRASNAKSDNQENDTEAQINLDNGGIVVKAGETRTMYVVVDVAAAADSANDEFALEIVDVVASSSVVLSGAKAATMKVGSVDAPTLEFKKGGSVSDPNLGEVAADIFEFEIVNDSDEDVELESITFEGSSDAEDNLINFELVMGNDVVATTAMMSGDYLTFETEGLVIEEDRTEDFTVRADVVDGAGDDISFRIDEKLDVTANSTKFDFGASVNIAAVSGSTGFGEITIQAGELTFVEIDAAQDEIRENKDNVELGGLKITNVSGQQLEMESFGIEITIDNGGNGALTGNTGGTLTVLELFDDVELYNEETGSSYELRSTSMTGSAGDRVTSTIYSDTNIDVILAEGSTTWSIRADTAEDIDNFADVSIDLNVDVTNDVVVVETADDEEVTDKTPSTLSFNTIDGSESGAQISLVSLADIDVVRGADDLVALQFEVEAEEVSEIIVDEITVRITATGGSAATNQQISEIKLYEGSVSESNLLDRESGSDLGSNGDVTFDRMEDVVIAANGETEFVVTVSFVDGVDAVNGSDYTVSVTDVNIDDDENDQVDVSGQLPLASGRQLTVNNNGTIQTFTYDDANEDNEFNKLALAGESVVIASFDVRADNEEVDVETVVFTLSGTTVPRDVFETATLLLDGVAIETNSNSDFVSSGSTSTFTVTFEDLNELIIPETTTELALQLNTANIGDDFTGETTLGLVVTNVVLDDAEGVESGKNLPGSESVSGLTTSTTTDVVPAIVTPSVTSNFGTNDQTAEFRLTVDGGENTDTDGDAVQAELAQVRIAVSSIGVDGLVTIFNGNGDEIGSANTTATASGVLAIDVTDDSIGNDNETYRIETVAEATFRLARNGIEYTINGDTANPVSTKLENTLELGQYVESN